MSRFLVPACLLSLLISAAFADDADKAKPPEGFTSLFNGKNLEGWKAHGGKAEAWGAEKGVLVVKGGGGGWLMTEKEYGDFELRLEFKVPKGGNSGVALRAPMKGNPAFAGMEIQILDDASHEGLKEWQATGSIYGVAPGKKLTAKDVGQWNSFRIVCKGRQVTIELNGEKIVDANLDDSKGGTLDKQPHPGLARYKGHVGLQEYNKARVEFRNIFIKEL